MDGNPPDYIGQQCRFMEYLCVCGLKTEDEALEQAGQEFCDRFLLGTAHRVAEAARENDLGEAVEKVLTLLKEAAALAPARVQDPGGALPFDSAQWERGPQLELEPPRVVGHASFCDCGNKCRMLSTVQEGCVLSILPDKDFMGKSFSGCPRGPDRQTGRRKVPPDFLAGGRNAGGRGCPGLPGALWPGVPLCHGGGGCVRLNAAGPVHEAPAQLRRRVS